MNAAETSLPKLRQSRSAFERMYEHDVLHRRVRCGLPVLIFANQLDVAYQEYNDSLERANTNGEVQQQQKHDIKDTQNIVPQGTFAASVLV